MTNLSTKDLVSTEAGMDLEGRECSCNIEDRREGLSFFERGNVPWYYGPFATCGRPS